MLREPDFFHNRRTTCNDVKFTIDGWCENWLSERIEEEEEEEEMNLLVWLSCRP